MAHLVLYIEDNLDNLMLVRRILQAEGFEVLEATSAEDGIRMAEQRIPDLILMDINMPHMDGLTATCHLRKIPGLQQVPIVALTANVMKNVLDETLAVGCDGYIPKPIDVDRLPEQINAFISRGNSRNIA